MTTVVRYALFQAPSAIIVAVLLWRFWDQSGLPAWLAVVVWLAWVAKDAVLYPLMRRAYEPSADGGGALVGLCGVARDRLDPEGYVRVRGELWWGGALEDEAPIQAGTAVRIQRVEGLKLFVRRASLAVEDPSAQ